MSVHSKRFRRALLFDVFGTLVDWRGSLIAQLRAWSAETGLAKDADFEGLVDAWRGAYAPAMDRVRHGARPWANLDVLHGESLDALLPQFGIAPLPPNERGRLVGMWHRLEAWPEVPAALERLRASFVTATLSNGHLDLQIDLCAHAGLRFDTLFSAETFGHYKPDPETYLGAARSLGRAPADICLVASHPSDLAAARACGLRTALVLRPDEYGPSRRAETAAAQWDPLGKDLVDLARMLEEAEIF